MAGEPLDRSDPADPGRTIVRIARAFRSIFYCITFERCAKSMFNRGIVFVCNTSAKSLFANRKAVDRRDFFPYSRAKWEKVG